MNRTDIMNKLIKWKGFHSYLEVGVENPDLNFNRIVVDEKECVDISPNAKATYTMSSDEFFATIPSEKKYDLIFVDAMHNEEFVDRDVTNSLKHLENGGIICIHDVIPISKAVAQKKTEYDFTVWNGDVYRSVVKLPASGLNYVTVLNNDFGLTILYDNDGKEKDLTKYKCAYEYEEIYNDAGPDKVTELGKELLHLITEDEFVKKFSES